MMMMMSLRDVNGKGDSFQQRHAHKKYEQQRSKERLCCCCSILSKSSIGCLFFSASKERERARFENARTNNVVTTQTVERGPKEQKLSIYYLGYQFLKKKKLKHLALKASSSTLIKYFLTTSEELLEERDERG